MNPRVEFKLALRGSTILAYDGQGTPGAAALMRRRTSYGDTGMRVTLRLRSICGAILCLGAASSVGVSSTSAQVPGAAPTPAAGSRPIEHTASITAPGQQIPGHPMQAALDWAQMSLAQCDQVRDYSFTFVKREEISGKLTDFEATNMKIRHQPFSLYIYTLGPVQPKGQEVIFVEGRNNNKVLAHVTGFRHKLIGTISLDQNAPELLEGNRYPPTNAGVQNMLRKIIAAYQTEMRDGESAVRVIPGAKVDGRNCTCVEVSHPQPRPNHPAHMTRMFYDDETKLPIRFEGYGWPTQAGQAPPLLEEYTYRNVKVNVGLTDADFDVNNPTYGFK